jgi:antitoxin ParD1/3/4
MGGIDPAITDTARAFRARRSRTALCRPAAPWLTTVDSGGKLVVVSRNTMSFALPESLRDYIDARVRSGEYGNTSEYLRDLIRRDQHDQAARRLRELISEGLESGPATPLTKQRVAEIRQQALSAES